MKKAGLRIDIDNIIDATTGLRELRSILNENSLKCTIFVHMGKSIHHLTLLKDFKRTSENIKGGTASHQKIGVGKKARKKGPSSNVAF